MKRVDSKGHHTQICQPHIEKTYKVGDTFKSLYLGTIKHFKIVLDWKECNAAGYLIALLYLEANNICAKRVRVQDKDIITKKDIAALYVDIRELQIDSNGDFKII